MHRGTVWILDLSFEVSTVDQTLAHVTVGLFVRL